MVAEHSGSKELEGGGSRGKGIDGKLFYFYGCSRRYFVQLRPIQVDLFSSTHNITHTGVSALTH